MDIVFHALTRQGSERTVNADAHRVDEPHRLFVVADGWTGPEQTAAALDTFFRVALAALPHGSREALKSAAAVTHKHLRGADTGLELAALHLGETHVDLVWSGNCRIYRARGPVLEILTGNEWSDTHLGSEPLALSHRRLDLQPGDTFVLSTDGFHRLGGDEPDAPLSRPDRKGVFTCTPIAELTATLMQSAAADDDATILTVRVPRPDLREGLEERIDRALEQFCEDTRDDGLVLVNVELRNPFNPPGVRHYPRLALEFVCDPLRGPGAAVATAAAFLNVLERDFPELGGPHECSVDPETIEPPEALAARIARIREIADPVLARHRGIDLGHIKPLPTWARTRKLDVLVIRDDCHGATDEDYAARDLAQAIAAVDPELARDLEVRGEYCK